MELTDPNRRCCCVELRCFDPLCADHTELIVALSLAQADDCFAYDYVTGTLPLLLLYYELVESLEWHLHRCTLYIRKFLHGPTLGTVHSCMPC